MRFQELCESYLGEEKLIGGQLNGRFVYMNPTRDELIRITYEGSTGSANDYNGYRAIFLPGNTQKADKLYATNIGVLHFELKQYVIETGLEDAQPE